MNKLYDQKHPYSSSDFFLHHLIQLVLSRREVSAQSSPEAKVFEV